MKRWDNLVSPSVVRREDEVIVQIGSTVVTRSQMIHELKCDYTRSGKTLTRALAHWHPKNAAELASRKTMDDMLDLKHVGELAIHLFGLILIHVGEDPCKWADGKLKIATRYAKVKGRKRKRRPRPRRGKLYVIRNAAR